MHSHLFLRPKLPTALRALTAAATLLATVGAQTVTGATVTSYASVQGPLRLAFASDGSLYCGRDSVYTGTATPQFLSRVAPGGSPVQQYGQATTPDPDVAVVDGAGSVSGIAGSVLTGGIKVANTTGSISAIRPDGSVVELWTSMQWVNPVDLKIDAFGRLLFTDHVSRGIWQSVGGAAPTLLFTMPNSATPNFLAIASDQSLYVGDSVGRIRQFSPTGTLLNGNVATFPSVVAIEFAPGGGFGSALFALGINSGALHTIAADGTVTAIGSGLGTQLGDLGVGPDGNFYYSNFATNEVRVIRPVASHVAYGVGCHAPAPLTLSASPAPVLNPSTTVTYTITNVPEFAPGSGVHVSVLFFSFTPLPAGLDLTGLLTTQPGCRIYLASLDVGSGGLVTAQPTASLPLTFAAPQFVPGNVLAAQAVALFDPAFPLANGESGGFVVSNGLRSSMQLQ